MKKLEKVIHFRKKVKDKRKALHLTQRDVADKLGISTSFYNQIENGYRNPRLETAVKLGELLSLDLKDFK